jgi:hypothetical protein
MTEKSDPLYYRALLIGGPKDGYRMTLPKMSPYVRAAVKLTPFSEVKELEYVLAMSSPVTGLLIYADPKMNVEDVFKKLHEGYLTEKQP